MQKQLFANVLQKQLSRGVLQKSCPLRFCNIHKNTCARVSLSIKLLAKFGNFIYKKTLAQMFPVNLEEHLFLQNTSGVEASSSSNRCSCKFPNVCRKISLLKPLFNTVRGLKAHNFNKKVIPAQAFSCEYHKIFKNSYFIEHLRWLPLSMRNSNSS